MRIPLATPLKTRVGDTSKDARLKNAYVEVRGDQSVVRKRPCARGGVEVGTGAAQGGIGLNIGGVDYIYTVNGDTGALDTLATAGTTWDSGTSYSIGDHVSYGFVDYWALTDNSNSDPSSNPSDWSENYVPDVPFAGTYATWGDVGNNITLSNGNLTVTVSGANAATYARATVTKTSGKWYWEYTIDQQTFVSTGIQLPAHSLSGEVGGYAEDYGFHDVPWFSGPIEGAKENNASASRYGGTPSVNGDVIGVALDLDSGTITYYRNGVSLGVMYSGLSGEKAIIAGAIVSGGTDPDTIITANFGQSAFAYSVPSGYNSGLYSTS